MWTGQLGWGSNPSYSWRPECCLTHTLAHTHIRMSGELSQRLWQWQIWESSTSGALSFHSEVKGGDGVCVWGCVNQRQREKESDRLEKSSLFWPDCRRGGERKVDKLQLLKLMWSCHKQLDQTHVFWLTYGGTKPLYNRWSIGLLHYFLLCLKYSICWLKLPKTKLLLLCRWQLGLWIIHLGEYEVEGCAGFQISNPETSEIFPRCLPPNSIEVNGIVSGAIK